MLALLSAESLSLPPEAPAIEYGPLRDSGARTPLHRGIQIGYFAIRVSAGEAVRDHRSRLPAGVTAGFCVDHIPTGLNVASIPVFEVAMSMADDLSIALGDKAATTNNRDFIRSIVPIQEWVFDCEEGKCSRLGDWLATQQARRSA